MVDLLRDGARWLSGKRSESMATNVTYSRGAATVAIAATVGRTFFEEADDSTGVMRRTETRDYLVLASALILSGSQTLPARGDRVTETNEGDAAVYEVISMNGEPCYRYSDVNRLTLRIHTRQVSD